MAKKKTEIDLLKIEIAEHLGYSKKLAENGWGGLTAKETGRIGGCLSRFLKERENNTNDTI
ncbi:MAG TPA: small, acid-soluble spore protein, alpha/beta type [Clostridia bacterium]|nr:small, acid-soluble spore protein, alpha/beta type [Clostridia bacterium]